MIPIKSSAHLSVSLIVAKVDHVRIRMFLYCFVEINKKKQVENFIWLEGQKSSKEII
jgi:hypothetical protein